MKNKVVLLIIVIVQIQVMYCDSVSLLELLLSFFLVLPFSFALYGGSPSKLHFISNFLSP